MDPLNTLLVKVKFLGLLKTFPNFIINYQLESYVLLMSYLITVVHETKSDYRLGDFLREMPVVDNSLKRFVITGVKFAGQLDSWTHFWLSHSWDMYF